MTVAKEGGGKIAKTRRNETDPKRKKVGIQYIVLPFSEKVNPKIKKIMKRGIQP